MSKYASAILTIVGTVVGAYFGPLGASLGAVLGSLVGGLAFPAHSSSTGPRLEDITSTNSSVGAGLPRGWGTFAVAGNICAQSDLREVMVTTTTGGKGTPSVSTTTPTYYQDFAILLTDTGDPDNQRPIAGYRTIWANGKPIYDRRPQAQGESDSDFQQRLAASDQLDTQITFYHGTEDQLPDPTLEAAYGVGQISALRGCCYMVFINWQNKSEDGNRMPSSWLFELYTDGSDDTDDVTEYANEVLYPWLPGGFPLNTGVEQQYTYSVFWASGSGSNVTDGINHSSLASAIAAVPDDQNVNNSAAYIDYCARADILSFTQYATSTTGGITLQDPGYSEASTIVLHYNDVIPINFIALTGSEIGFGCDVINQPGQTLPIRMAFADRWNYDGTQGVVYGKAPSSSAPPFPDPAEFGPEGWNRYVGCGGAPPSGSGNDMYESQDFVILATRAPIAPPDPCDSTGATPAPKADGSSAPKGQGVIATIIAAIQGYVLVSGELRKCASYVKTNGTWLVLQKYAVDTSDPVNHQVTAYPLGPARPLGHHQYSDEAFWTDAYDTAVARGQMPAGLVYGTDYPAAQGFAYQRTLNQHTTDSAPALVSDVTRELCVESGYDPVDLDVSDLAGMTVQGYIRTGTMTGRAALTPLAQAKFFDGIESNGKLKFVKRGGENQFALRRDDDLGCVVAGAEPIPQITIQSADETTLPRSVTVTYLSPSRDYGVGSQISPTRIQTTSTNDLAITLPMVMTDDEAKATATRLWAVAWAEADSYSSVIDGVRQELEPTDCGTLPVDGLNRRVRITSIGDSLPITRALTMVRDDSLSYTPTPIASVPPFVPSPIRIAAPAAALYLDLPALTDSDSDPGFYVAFHSQLTGAYRGAALFRSLDDGSSFSQVCGATNEATIGTLVTAPGDADWDTWEGGDSLRIELLTGSFSSATDDAVLAGANALAVGQDGRWEIIQFQTATHVQAEIWTLSGLLRGRRGTEHNIGTALPGDTVVLVSGPGIVRASMPITAVGRPYLYRSLGTGVGLDQATDDTFAGHAEALKPFSPADFVGDQDLVTSLWTLSWIRRGRLGQTLASGIDVPLSEDSENYEVDILSGPGGSVLRVLSTSTPIVTLDKDQQITLFGSIQTHIHAVAYQLSGQVGRGYGTVGDFTGRFTSAPGAQVYSATITFGGAPTPAEQWLVYFSFLSNSGGAARLYTFYIAGGSPNGTEVHAADLAAQIAGSTLAPDVIVARVLGVVTVTTSTGVLAAYVQRNWPVPTAPCGQSVSAVFPGPISYRVQDALPAPTTGQLGFYGVDFYDRGGGLAPASDISYNGAGTYVKRFKIRNLDADLNLAFQRDNTPPGTVVAGDYCFASLTHEITLQWNIGPKLGAGTRTIADVFSVDGTGAGISAAAAAHPVLGPLMYGGGAAVTGNRPCVEIVLLDGWAFLDDEDTVYFGDPTPSGWTLLTSTLPTQFPIKDYPHGRGQIDTFGYRMIEDQNTGLPLLVGGDIDTSMTFRVTVDGTHYDHAVDSTDLADVSPITGMPHYLDRIFGDLAAQVRATGQYDVTLIERDGRTGSPSAYVLGMSIKSKTGGVTYDVTPTILPDPGMTVTVVLESHHT